MRGVDPRVNQAGRQRAPSAFRREDDAEQDALIGAYLPRRTDVGAAVRRDHVVDLVARDRHPFAVHLDLIMIVDRAALCRTTIHQVAAGTATVIALELRVEALVPAVVAGAEISLLRHRARAQNQEGAPDQGDELRPPHSSLRSNGSPPLVNVCVQATRSMPPRFPPPEKGRKKARLGGVRVAQPYDTQPDPQRPRKGS